MTRLTSAHIWRLASHIITIQRAAQFLDFCSIILLPNAHDFFKRDPPRWNSLMQPMAVRPSCKSAYLAAADCERAVAWKLGLDHLANADHCS
jgi:hypothetical protein